jgi:hypothetical protein
MFGWVFVKHEHACASCFGCGNDFFDASSAIMGPMGMHMEIRAMLFKWPSSWHRSPFSSQCFYGTMHCFELLELKFRERIGSHILRDQNGNQQSQDKMDGSQMSHGKQNRRYEGWKRNRNTVVSIANEKRPRFDWNENFTTNCATHWKSDLAWNLKFKRRLRQAELLSWKNPTPSAAGIP